MSSSPSTMDLMRPIHFSGPPIFLVGYPRSGTTLMQSLLATQPGIVSIPETHFFSSCASHLPPDARVSPEDAMAVAGAVQAKMGFEFERSRLEGFLVSTGKDMVSKKDLFEFIVSMAISAFSPAKYDACRGDVRFLEKTPSHANCLAEIMAIYPGAKIVVMLRNPLEAIASRKHRIPTDRHRSIRSLARSWVRHYANVLENQSEKMRIVRLEDVVCDEVSVMEELCSFLEIALDRDALRNFGVEAKTLVSRGETWKADVVRGGIMTGSAASLPWFDRLMVQTVTGKMARKLGC